MTSTHHDNHDIMHERNPHDIEIKKPYKFPSAEQTQGISELGHWGTWKQGTLGHQDTGTPGHRSTETPGHWDTGTLEHWETGTK